MTSELEDSGEDITWNLPKVILMQITLENMEEFCHV